MMRVLLVMSVVVLFLSIYGEMFLFVSVSLKLLLVSGSLEFVVVILGLWL